MKGIFQKVYIGISLIFLLFLLGYFFAALSTSRNTVLEEAHDVLDGQIASLRRIDASIPYNDVIGELRRSESRDRIAVIVVYRESAGISALWSRNRDYLANLPENIDTLRGRPNLVFNDIYEEQITRLLPDGASLTVIYQAILLTDLYPIMISILYILIAFAAFTLVYLVIAIITQNQNTDDGIEYYPGESGETSYKNTSGTQASKNSISPEAPDEKGLPRQDDTETLGELDSISQDEDDAPSAAGGSNAQVNSSPEDFDAQENRIWPSKLLRLRLNNEIERSAENENDISFVVFRLSRGLVKDSAAREDFEDRLLRFFRYEDMVFSLDKNYYCAIMPNHDQGESVRQVEKFLIQVEGNGMDESELYAGISSRSGRLMGGDRLLKEGLKAAGIAGPKKGRIIAFKADPQKYRSHLMGAPK